MRVTVVKIGRVAYPEIKALAAMYEQRLVPFAKVEGVEAKDLAQATKLLRRPFSEHPVIALDERGKELTSVAFAETLRRLSDDPGIKSVSFLVGGPMGLPAEIKREARLVLSLAKGTTTSDLAWLLLWEQLYRAYNILKGTDYHHE